ncbi:DEAD/DEAH box helicase [Paenibacillus alginolyticus]|uniref:DEAD/DEAH box helicase n=1 Tax=Paenibacillus alginolyticus TaxID=59839 RepID=A0ABT4GNT5_9BACL|nr:DEAD/DEAH box helicase [Paenibacillus alginolyticus]MCY9697842.1 DEAD/DEAH box helicase [Paenibacillus alginolyticus]MEC0141892.1 DEAD/DEAH box helicase [Paenibacillus alginolyticus]
MSTKLHDMTLNVTLTDSGDALLWGLQDGRDVPGDKFRKLLFAWHEPSYYGTILDQQVAGELTLTVLPVEMVLPFFAEPYFMDVLRWEGGNETTKGLLEVAPVLYREAKAGHYVPSYSAFRNGNLAWTWDVETESLNELDWHVLQSLEGLGEGMSGLRAAFSAVVSAEHYPNEASLSDLRRDYPVLFRAQKSAPISADAFTEEEWLASLGWRPDTAPFRPALQLLEPDENDDTWRLRLVLQDKNEGTLLTPIRLHADGRAAGTWASDWSPYILERSLGWATRIIEALPGRNNGGELFAEPLSDEAAWSFLTTDSRHLLEDGWNVMLPGWWEAASKRKPRLRAKVSSEAGSKGESLFGLNSLVNFDWRIAIGNTDLSEAEFAKLLSRNERLIRFRGQWVILDPALLEQIRRIMESVNPEEGLSLQDIFQLHLLSESEKERAQKESLTAEEEADNEERLKLEVELNAHLLALLRQLGQPSELKEIAVPAGLRAELRKYQHEGFTWLSFLRKFGLGACLADDMGLGKTVQFITYLLHHRAESEHPALLICPTSVLGNWQKELVRFAPDLKVFLHYGKGRLSGEALAAILKDTDVVLTSYTTALMDQETLQETTWSSLCLDEAQNIKNAQNKQSAAIRTLKARHRIALTGTPIENRLSELWSIYDFLNPGYLGNQRGFQHRFANPIEKHHDEERTAQLQKLVKPFMLRRKKKDPAIQLDLPDKLEMKVFINLTAEQGALYEQSVKDLMERMQKLEGMERKGAILAALTQLKQLCDHPMLLTKEDHLSEETLLSEESREAFVMRSGKLERLVAMVGELRDEGDSCLIFTQYVGMGRILADVLRTQRNEPVLYLNGSTPKSERDKMIDTFQAADGTGPGIFVLSLKAGGVGLNLTAANHVFHFDRWWNPAVENQATDRAYRMGQTRNVQVHKFISLGTLEERIDEMLESKMSLSENVISTSEGWITELSNDELRDLFALRKEW